MENKIREILNEAVATGMEHGIQCVVWRDGKKIVDLCAGTRLPDGNPVTPDTRFPVFSGCSQASDTQSAQLSGGQP